MHDSNICPESERVESATLQNVDFWEDVRRGLGTSPKFLPCKYFYDERGSKLFDQICELEEYYPTRTELSITQENIDEIAECLGRDAALIEFGSGSSVKTRELLDHLNAPAAYLPVDVSEEHLLQTSRQLQADYPQLSIHPVVADFTHAFELPSEFETVRKQVYFPGSTIGNLVRSDAIELLENVAALCRPEGGAIIGFDLQKPTEILELAYNDPHGVTAEFNLNILRRINRELDGDLELGQFRHVSFYNPAEGRMEIYIESKCEQTACIAGREFEFAQGERICTEYSHKYTIEGFAEMASEAGLQPDQVWTDDRNYFAIMHLTCHGS